MDPMYAIGHWGSTVIGRTQRGGTGKGENHGRLEIVAHLTKLVPLID